MTDDTACDPDDPVEALIRSARFDLAHGTDLARDVAAHRLAGQVKAAVAGQVAGLCDWAQGLGDARDVTHAAFHFGYPCPYFAASEVLRGKPDPRRADARTQSGEQHRTEPWRLGHIAHGGVTFGWDCLDCTEHGRDLADGLAAERGAEWHARHPHHQLPRAGAFAEVPLAAVDWRALPVFFEGVSIRVSDDGFDAWVVFPDGREASERDLLVIMPGDADTPPGQQAATPAAPATASPLAQRYTDPRAHARMAAGNCPGCGQPPDTHTGSGAGQCQLTDNGAADRIAQYRADLEGESER